MEYLVRTARLEDLCRIQEIYAYARTFMAETGKWITIGAVCVASLVILIKHFENIKRLIKGEEIGFRRAMSKKDKISKQ